MSLHTNRNFFAEYQNYLTFLGESNADTHDRLLRNLRAAINEELTERQQAVVDMYYIRKIKIAEIATTLGVNPSTVSRTLKLARERLRKTLKYGAKELLAEEYGINIDVGEDVKRSVKKKSSL